MALTPDDVVNKRFQPTKFREGYDQDEVDDFLDSVVNELRRLTTENDELREKLGACERRVGELTRSGAGGVEQGKQIQGVKPDGRPEPVTLPPQVVPAAAAASAQVAAPAATAAPPAAVSGPEAATAMLALAQKLHDEHVRSGEEQRDKLIAEAREHAQRLVSQAEEKQRQTLGTLEQQRTVLERKIEELRSFERDYRSRLKSYLEGQLKELETAGNGSPVRDDSGGAHNQGFAGAV